MIVIDASAIAAFLLGEPRHEIVEHRLLQEGVHSVDFVMAERASAILRAARRAHDHGRGGPTRSWKHSS